MNDDEQIAVPVKGGSLDGTSRSMFRHDLVEGSDFTVRSREASQAARQAEPPVDPAVMPDQGSERYVLRRLEDDWLFEHAGRLGDSPPLSSPS